MKEVHTTLIASILLPLTFSLTCKAEPAKPNLESFHIEIRECDAQVKWRHYKVSLPSYLLRDLMLKHPLHNHPPAPNLKGDIFNDDEDEHASTRLEFEFEAHPPKELGANPDDEIYNITRAFPFLGSEEKVWLNVSQGRVSAHTAEHFDAVYRNYMRRAIKSWPAMVHHEVTLIEASRSPIAVDEQSVTRTLNENVRLYNIGLAARSGERASMEYNGDSVEVMPSFSASDQIDTRNSLHLAKANFELHFDMVTSSGSPVTQSAGITLDENKERKVIVRSDIVSLGGDPWQSPKRVETEIQELNDGRVLARLALPETVWDMLYGRVFHLTKHRIMKSKSPFFHEMQKECAVFDLKTFLLKEGITFRDGDWAVFHPDTSSLYALMHRDGFDLLEHLLSATLITTPRLLTLKGEIWQVNQHADTQWTKESMKSSNPVFVCGFSGFARSGLDFKYHSNKGKNSFMFEPTLSDDGVHIDAKLALSLEKPGLSIDSSFVLKNETAAYIDLGQLSAENGKTHLLVLHPVVNHLR